MAPPEPDWGQEITAATRAVTVCGTSNRASATELLRNISGETLLAYWYCCAKRFVFSSLMLRRTIAGVGFHD
jgi:hypothetical protein